MRHHKAHFVATVRELKCVAVALVGVVILSGCAAEVQPAYVGLDQEQRSEDALPSDAKIPSDADHETSRLVASRDGRDYYLISYKDESDRAGVCIVVSSVEGGAETQAACGVGGQVGISNSLIGSIKYVAPSVREDLEQWAPDGWSILSDDLIIEDS